MFGYKWFGYRGMPCSGLATRDRRGSGHCSKELLCDVYGFNYTYIAWRTALQLTVYCVESWCACLLCLFEPSQQILTVVVSKLADPDESTAAKLESDKVINRNKDKGLKVAVLSMDLSSAYDMVEHKLLLSKLECL